jgi:tRNA(Met) C34 N-acetyltransferase TmcA
MSRYYKESHKILGQTFEMCILQDFEAITPNLLAQTIETVEGGGLVILMLKTMSSLKQLYTMSMVCLPFCFGSLLTARRTSIHDTAPHLVARS